VSESIRAKLKTIISDAGNPAMAALEVCLFLEDNLDLAGNGWFDDDPWLLKIMNGAPVQLEDEKERKCLIAMIQQIIESDPDKERSF
jgi:hypothetical protein